jgi:nitrate reductase gamma subunit
MSDIVFFVVFPYLAILLAVIFGVYRYFADSFSYSSFSSQFLESEQLFWGSAPWHYSILIILIAHILAALFPGAWGALISEPVRLYVLELSGLALGFLTVAGTVLLIVRRLVNPRVTVVTSAMDWVLLVVLLVQVASGVYIALVYRWGSAWYLHTAGPWLWSLAKLDPQVRFVTTLPIVVKFHMLNAFLVISLLPFTRLVHIFTIPVAYLWRPYQLQIWNRRAK